MEGNTGAPARAHPYTLLLPPYLPVTSHPTAILRPLVTLA